MDGLINLRKEAGFTSHDAVAVLRGILRTRRIGHTGTLDPAAEGVLPVCVGKATVLAERLTDKTKTYETVMLLGVTTDTEDTTGTVLTENGAVPDGEAVREAVLSFEGTYDQVPPMYSARKVNGKKLYELAREGKTAERKPVPVTLSDIRILDMDLPRVRFSVTCTRGTYIRTLCADIGAKLGCGACMESLLRIRAGEFTLDTAVTLDEVRARAEAGTLSEIVTTLDEFFGDLPCLTVREEGEKRLANGNPLPVAMAEEAPPGARSVRLHDRSGNLTGIYRLSGDGRFWQPDTLFLRK